MTSRGPMTVLAIDQGTTSTKALLVSDAGVVPLASRTHRQSYPRAGWVEHDPAELLADIRACLDAAPPGIAAIGLAHQGESCLAWDGATAEPLTPVIVWQDDRTRDRTDALRRDGAEALTLARAGLPLDPYFSASKLGWIMAHVPQAAALRRAGRLRLGTTDAWFRQVLTGRCATDAASASRTSLMGLAGRGWDADLCALFGVPLDALPPIGPSAGDLGTVRVQGRAVPLTACIVDQQAALYGHGARVPGQAKITFGTGAFALALYGNSPPPAGGGVLPTLAWDIAGQPPAYALEGGVATAAAAVNWAQGLGLLDDLAAINGPGGDSGKDTGGNSGGESGSGPGGSPGGGPGSGPSGSPGGGPGGGPGGDPGGGLGDGPGVDPGCGPGGNPGGNSGGNFGGSPGGNSGGNSGGNHGGGPGGGPSSHPAIARGLAFVPALTGLACPHWDRGARGAWFGLSLDTTRRDMLRAVLEGVAFRMAEVIAAMAAVTPLTDPIGIDGGMSANRPFCQFLADTLARPLAVSGQPELTALGVAQLAAAALGVTLAPPLDSRAVAPRAQPPAWAARFAAARQAAQHFGRAG